MAGSTDTAALVALLRSGAHPWQIYADLLEEAGSARALLARIGASGGGLEVAREDIPGGTPQAQLFADPPASPPEPAPEPALDAAEADIGTWRSQGMRIVTVLDAAYPENLLAVHDRPPFVFVAGDLRREDARSVAVIGSRRAGEHGLRVAARIAGALVADGYTVVSGLAAGIDTAAHLAALEHGGRTIAVLGTGLQRCYPSQNAALQARIGAEGALISQFWPDTPPSRTTFPQRNAVMSGVSLATVIVEAGARSGARIQARLALAHGRPVILWHELLSLDWARALAARPGAHVARRAEEVAEIVGRLTGAGALTP